MKRIVNFGNCSQCGGPLRKRLTEDGEGKHDYILVCPLGHENGEEWTEVHFSHQIQTEGDESKNAARMNRIRIGMRAAGVAFASIVITTAEVYFFLKLYNPTILT